MSGDGEVTSVSEWSKKMKKMLKTGWWREEEDEEGEESEDDEEEEEGRLHMGFGKFQYGSYISKRIRKISI